MVDKNGAPIYVNVAPTNTHDSLLPDSIVSNMRKSKQIRIIAADSAFDVKRLHSLCKEKNIALWHLQMLKEKRMCINLISH